MKLWDIAKSIGGGLLKDAIPMGGTLGKVLGVVNAVLPGGSKLDENSTGAQLTAAIEGLPAEHRAEVMDKQFDLQIEELRQTHGSLNVMLETEVRSTHSTRPWIAKGCFLVLAFIHCAVAIGWFVAIWLSDRANILDNVMDGWPFVLALTTPFVILLKAYFGLLAEENKNKLAAAGGRDAPPLPTGITGVLSRLLG